MHTTRIRQSATRFSASSSASQATNALPPPASNSNKPVALRIVGSNVKNQKGEYLGRMENVTINPESKQVEYAQIALCTNGGAGALFLDVIVLGKDQP